MQNAVKNVLSGTRNHLQPMRTVYNVIKLMALSELLALFLKHCSRTNDEKEREALLTKKKQKMEPKNLAIKWRY